ncbi:hypothetical protein ACO2Q3_10935 [Caulobacter sp. KR2-114]|uniref:hypothetical protein n=1 Tax=Caulobacter sp. KR2-114 TaxID=3400912 RepID=UPI003BFBB0FD
MASLDAYLRRAAASQRADFTLPVIDTAEEAIAVVREVAERLRTLEPDQQLCLASDLKRLSQAMAQRVQRLRRDQGTLRQRILQARTARSRHDAYAAAGRPPGKPPV